MWNGIIDEQDIQDFMTQVCFFHDSCIKEMKYTSGAYVNKELSMWPINDKRALNIVFQRQFEELSMIELQFIGLKYLKLFPSNDEFTCEILSSTMFIKNGDIYWCDSGDISVDNHTDYEGTLICASKLLWRKIEGCMGNDAFYLASM